MNHVDHGLDPILEVPKVKPEPNIPINSDDDDEKELDRQEAELRVGSLPLVQDVFDVSSSYDRPEGKRYWQEGGRRRSSWPLMTSNLRSWSGKGGLGRNML